MYWLLQFIRITAQAKIVRKQSNVLMVKPRIAAAAILKQHIVAFVGLPVSKVYDFHNYGFVSLQKKTLRFFLWL